MICRSESRRSNDNDYELMDLHPQANTQRSSVIYIPTRSSGPAKGEVGTPKSLPKDAGK